MSKMGRYCKAYPITRLREFKGWTENAQNARKEERLVDEKEVEIARELQDSSYLYLQENYTVTDGVFIDQNLIFDQVTPEWEEFCRTNLKFEVPAYQSIAATESAEARPSDLSESAPGS